MKYILQKTRLDERWKDEIVFIEDEIFVNTLNAVKKLDLVFRQQRMEDLETCST